MKPCKTCGEMKPLDSFPKQSSEKDGRRPHCRECFNKREVDKQRARYASDPAYKEKTLAKNRGREYKPKQEGVFCSICGLYIENVHGKTKYCNSCRPTNYYKHRERKNRYPELSKQERRKAYWADWYLNNKERVMAKNRKVMASPQGRFMGNLRRRHRHMLDCGITTTMKLLGMGYKDYAQHFIASDAIMWEEWCRGNSNLVIDHIIPVCLYDIYNEKDVVKCWNPRNLRIITKGENLKKSGKLYMDLVEQEEITDLLPASLLNADGSAKSM